MRSILFWRCFRFSWGLYSTAVHTTRAPERSGCHQRYRLNSYLLDRLQVSWRWNQPDRDLSGWRVDWHTHSLPPCVDISLPTLTPGPIINTNTHSTGVSFVTLAYCEPRRDATRRDVKYQEILKEFQGVSLSFIYCISPSTFSQYQWRTVTDSAWLPR